MFQRKCWWDGIEVDVAEPGEPSKIIKLWARRVWTLELSLVCALDLHVHITQLKASAYLQLGMIRIRTFYYACLAGFALDTLITLDVRYHGAFNAAFILRIGCRAASQFC